ncbi:MAG: PA14 domain-containing protein [Verrucomicrobiota bacterium]
MKQWIKTYRVELLLFLLLWATYAYFYQSTQDNEAARFDQIRALVEDHTLAINKHWWNTADVIHYQKDGTDHIYPNKAPGMSLLATAPYAILAAFLRPFSAAGVPEWIYWHLLTYLTIVFTVGLLSALAAVAFYRVLLRMSNDRYFSILTILAIWLGTLAFPFSTLFFSHQVAAALLAFAFCLLFQVGRDGVASSRRGMIKMGAAGLLMGLCITTEYPTALLVGLLLIYAVWAATRHELLLKRRAILLGAGAMGLLIGGGLLVIYNVAAYGKIFYLPYEAYTTKGAYFHSTYSQGWLGMHWPGFRNFWHALGSILIYPPIGLLYLGIHGWRVYACNPVLWLSLPGLAIMIWKREWRPEGLLVAAMSAVYLLFITSYGKSIYDWSGASYLGPRHIIPVLPFLALPLYFGARRLRFVFYPLFAISVFYMLLATAVEPRVPFPFEIPARDLLLPDYLRGKLAQNTLSLFDSEHRNLTRDSTAFNLAKAVGVSGPYQLVPLMLWWLMAGGTLMFVSARGELERSRYSPRSALIILSLFASAIAAAPIVQHTIVSGRSKDRGLMGKYYPNANWRGEPVDVQVDPVIDFDWAKSLPLPPPFSVEWLGNILIENPDTYTFALKADDGALLEIDGRMIVDVTHVLLEERNATIYLARGLHPVRIRYFNTMFGGSIRLWWTETGRSKQIVPREVLLPPSPTKF